MSKRIATLFFILLLNNAFAWEPDTAVNPRFIIKTPILSYIDIFGGLSYRLGAEFRIHENLAASVEVGSYFHYQSDNRKGGIAKAEFKYYRNDNRCTGNFISIEYLYKNITFNFTDSLALPSKVRIQKEYQIHKEISCLTVKWGELQVYKKRLVFEWYLGVGIRVYTKAYNNLTPEENEAIMTGEGHGDLVGAALRSVGAHWTPNLNAGIKIGYLLK